MHYWSANGKFLYMLHVCFIRRYTLQLLEIVSCIYLLGQVLLVVVFKYSTSLLSLDLLDLGQ